jgi:hypothetical protein
VVVELTEVLSVYLISTKLKINFIMVYAWASLCGICAQQSGIGTGFSLKLLVLSISIILQGLHTYTGIPLYSALHLALLPKSTVVQYFVVDFSF